MKYTQGTFTLPASGNRTTQEEWDRIFHAWPSIPTETRPEGNPYRYGTGWTIEQHRDELIDRLGKAIKRINELEKMVNHV